MAVTEGAAKIQDIVTAELVECAPPETPEVCVQPSAEVASPTDRAREATIEQTGADPPPAVSRG